MITLIARVIAAVCFTALLGTLSAQSGGIYPLKVGPNGRYLVDQNDAPFLIVGDSPQGLITNLSPAQAAAYFANRALYGFNSAQIHLIAGNSFGGRTDYSTYDGITPFITNGDISTPRESYFARVDTILNLAAQNGIVVFLTAAETIDSLTLFRSNGVAKSRAFGRYLGNRYKGFSNIVWVYGNDFQTWTTASDNAVILAVANGVKDTDSVHLHTAWLNFTESASRDSPDWDAVINLDFVYTYYPTYAKVLNEYALVPAKPIFMGESYYEGAPAPPPLGTPHILRRQLYWAMTSGAAGSVYGNPWLWPFKTGWQDHLDTPGAEQMTHFKNFFLARRWWTFVPDPLHQVLTAGYGTYDPTGDVGTVNYATATLASDSSVMIAYLPSIRTVTVNMAKLSGPVAASWFDPSNGLYEPIAGSPFSNTGSRQFTPSGNNSDGTGDWLLVLESPSVDVIPPTITNVAVTNITTTSAVITWLTNEPADSQVSYGPTTSYGATTPLAPTLVTMHTVTLSGLSQATGYHFAVQSKDAAGNVAASGDTFFSTVNPLNTAPTISVLAPQTIEENTSTGPQAFTVGDAETSPGSLAVSATTSDATLTPLGSIVLGGTGTNRTITVTPATNHSGEATITVTVSDGQATASTSFLLTVNSANDAPTITPIANQVTIVNFPVGPISFTVDDTETAAGSLTLAGTSSNQTLVPNANIAFGGSGANRTVTVTPASGQTGSATITVTVSDGSLTAFRAFTITVNPVSGGGPVAAYNFDQGTGTTLTDYSGNANHGAISGATWTTAGKYGGALTFNGSSSLVLINSSPSLDLTTAMTIEAWVYPTESQSGWRTIVQRQVDAYLLHASSNSALRPAGGGTFDGTLAFVASPSALPLNTWTHLTVTYDQANIRLFVNGLQVASQARTGLIETPSTPVRIGGNVPYGEFFLGRIDDIRIYNRALPLAEIQADMNTPVAGTVIVPGAPPTISVIGGQTTTEGTPIGPVPFTVGDADTALSSLMLSGSSSNPTLVPNAGIAFGGSGANRTVTVSPAAGQTGTATITVTVSDGTSSATSPFIVTVNPLPPVITSASTATGTVGVNFTYSITATHSPSSYGATGLPANLTVNSATGVISGIPAASGTSLVTLTATNVSGSGTANLSLTVNSAPPPNTAPTISAIADQTTPANTPAGPIGFTVGDTETAAGSLTLAGTSSNQTLVPNANIAFGGSVANRTVTVTPASGQTGSATITVTVSDGSLTATSSFTLTVNPVAASGPVAAYNFDQGTGTTLTDYSGNANHGAISGATWTTAGKYGGALTFNGSSSMVVVNSSPSLNLTTAMTIEAWVYPTGNQSGWRTIVQREVDAYFLHASSNAALRPAGGGTFADTMAFVAAPSALPLRTWTHLAVTYDQAAIRLFVNGVLAASQARTGTIQTTSTPVRIGGNVLYGEYFLGRIDEVHIYNRALSITEIQADMNSPSP